MEYNIRVNKVNTEKVLELSYNNTFIDSASANELLNCIKDNPDYVAFIARTLTQIYKGNLDKATLNELSEAGNKLVLLISVGFELGYAAAKLDSGELYA